MRIAYTDREKVKNKFIHCRVTPDLFKEFNSTLQGKKRSEVLTGLVRKYIQAIKQDN